MLLFARRESDFAAFMTCSTNNTSQNLLAYVYAEKRNMFLYLWLQQYPYNFLWAEVLWWIFSKVNLFPVFFQNTSKLTGVQHLLKNHSLSVWQETGRAMLPWSSQIKIDDVYLVILPEACNIFLIVVHIWPASKLLDDFWFTLEGLWKLLNHRDIVFKRFNEVIHIKNIRENVVHTIHKFKGQ